MERTTSRMTVAVLYAESDIKLLELMALRVSDEAVAEAAFQVFYERHERFLLGITLRVCWGFPGSSQELVQAVINNTFLKVYKRADTFDPTKVRAEDMAAGVKAWMGTIADNEYKQLLRDEKKNARIRLVEDLSIFEDGELPDETDQVDGPVSYERELLDQAMASLSDRERYILVQSFAYEQEGHHLPDEFLDSTCRLFNITKAYFRTIKSLALRKVKDRILQQQALSN